MVFGRIQLNWSLHVKVCSFAPDLPHFPYGSMVLVDIFFFVSPKVAELQVHFN